MKQFFEDISNREASIFIWVGFIIIALCFQKKILKSFIGLIKAFFAKRLFSLIIAFTLYIALFIIILYKLKLWNSSFLKDTIFWYFTVAMILFFKINTAKDRSFFKTTIVKSFKLTILLEFIVNFYNFSLPIELVLTPFLLLIAMTEAYAGVYSKQNPEYKQVDVILKTILSIFGLIFIFYSLYMTIRNFSKIFTLHNLYELLLPPVLTLLILPFLYLLAVHMNYETLFVRLRFILANDNTKREMQKRIFQISKFNLNKITKIDNDITKLNLYNDEDFKNYINKY